MRHHLPKESFESGLFHFLPGDRARIERIASHNGSRVLPVNLSEAGSRQQVLHALGQALALPAWYGANFDALHDCLADDEWRGQHGSFVLISGLATLRQAEPSTFTTLLEVLTSAAQAPGTKHPLWLLLDTSTPGVPPLPAA